MSNLEIKYRDLEVTSNANGVASNEYIAYTDNSSTEKKTLKFFDGLTIIILNIVTSEGFSCCKVEVNGAGQFFDSEESAQDYINYYLDK